MTNALDKRVNAESAKMKKDIDDKVEDLRKEFEAHFDDISEKLERLTTLVNKNTIVSSNEDDTKRYNMVIKHYRVGK